MIIWGNVGLCVMAQTRDALPLSFRYTFDYFEYFEYSGGLEVAMPTTITHNEAMLPPVGTALVPTAHDREIAAESRQTRTALAQATGDLTLTVTGAGGTTGEFRVPASALRILFAALSEMACGNGVSLLPLATELTTQEAANLLNVSRPYLVGLLEKGDMPFRKVGNQRRVRLQDLMDYKARSDVDRGRALDELARLGQEIGVGYEL
jgi:excisionase family DNA binding protein